MTREDLQAIVSMMEKQLAGKENDPQYAPMVQMMEHGKTILAQQPPSE